MNYWKLMLTMGFLAGIMLIFNIASHPPTVKWTKDEIIGSVVICGIILLLLGAKIYEMLIGAIHKI